MKSIKLIIESLQIRNKAIQDKVWISQREIVPFLLVVLWITDTTDTPLKRHFYVLEAKFQKLWKHNGPTFLFNYLKGVTHVLIRYFALTPVTETYNSKVLVKVCKHTGLPIIFGKELNSWIIRWNRSYDLPKIIALFSFIGVFRSLPTKVPVSLSTITDKFDGKTDTFNHNTIKSAIDHLNIKLKFSKNIKPIYSTKAGPNSFNSLWGAEIDAFALLRDRSVLIPFIRYLIVNRSFLFLSWYILIIILGSPYYYVSCLFKTQRPDNGRLSVVYNQAGKARVVAMTNWWIQCCFKPLHDGIFNTLRGISTDATFDQKGRLLEFVSRTKGQKYFCYDLSAATDRLPIRLQTDILNILGVQGTNWSDMITNIKWKYKSNLIQYSVGQPMGAYSSWAMLALTHHIIVMMAADSVNKAKSFDKYIVLGDDIVIADEDVAKAYLEYMSMLGVKINLSKSIVSSEILEFAKLWLNPKYDISPIGSGLIIQAMRDKYSFISLVNIAWQRNLFQWSKLWISMRTAPKVVKTKIQYAVWFTTMIKLSELYKTSSDRLRIDDLFYTRSRKQQGQLLDSLHRDEWMHSDYASINGYPISEMIRIDMEPDYELYSIWRGLLDVFAAESEKIFKTNYQTIYKSGRSLLLYSWRASSLRIGLPDFFDLLLLPIKPGIWIHVRLLIIALGENLWWHFTFVKLKLYNKYLFNSSSQSLTHFQVLWFLSKILDLNSNVHFYEEEVQKKKDLSKLLRKMNDNNHCNSIVRALKDKYKNWDS